MTHRDAIYLALITLGVRYHISAVQAARVAGGMEVCAQVSGERLPHRIAGMVCEVYLGGTWLPFPPQRPARPTGDLP